MSEIKRRAAERMESRIRAMVMFAPEVVRFLVLKFIEPNFEGGLYLSPRIQLTAKESK